MESVHRKNEKANEMSAAEEEQMESLFEKLKPSDSLRTVNEKIEKCEIQLEECGDIDEIFMKLYGQPGHPISTIEREETIKKENARRKRAESMTGESREDEKPVENNRNGMHEIVDEDLIENDSVIFEKAEVNLDAIFEDLESSENVERPANWLGNFFPCSVV